ncbi:hypothetical protein PP713_13840 [Mycobacterium sp. CSUR Q5927]|nr:hypothetical protein [Mycobacterium sp. CSUR Q5927]
MTAVIEAWIAEVLREHTPFEQFDIEMDPVGRCGREVLGSPGPCDAEMHHEDWPAHLAAVLVKELGLKRECGHLEDGYVTVTRPTRMSRYVTDWSRDE